MWAAPYPSYIQTFIFFIFFFFSKFAIFNFLLLLDYVSRVMKSKFVRRSSVSQFSLNLMHRFFSKILVVAPPGPNAEAIVLRIFFLFVNMGP